MKRYKPLFESQTLFEKFLEDLEYYQSNINNAGVSKDLYLSFINLPEEIKKKITIKNISKSLYRGVEFVENKIIMSFTPNKGLADFFGYFTLPFTALKNYDAIVDTTKVVKYMNKLKLEYDIGDDEDEYLVIEGKWNNTVKSNIEQYRN